MGALHEGHISLIESACAENELVVSSIFVNPTQFNSSKDYDRYPRQLETDVAMLAKAGCDVLFHPNVEQIYPTADNHVYDLGAASKRLEGAFRPGHFNGVASVVKRLISLVEPHKAYFGLKDYQQFLVIKTLVKSYGIPIEIIGCETMRDASGLAMSSRNMLLNAEGRQTATHLFKALSLVKAAFQAGRDSALESMGKAYLKGVEDIDLEYFDIAESDTLAHIGDHKIRPDIQPIALVAAVVNDVRLIDNMLLK
jgi:pantoate--beta-alanine ligase